MRLRLLILTFSVITASASGQSSVKLSGILDSINLTEIVLYKCGVRESWNFDPRTDISMAIDSSGNFGGEFSIDQNGFYHLGDLYRGHIVFLSPGDSIFISLVKHPDSVRNRIGVYYLLKPKCEYPLHITFFDTLTEVFGRDSRYHVDSGSPEEFVAAQLNLHHQKVALLREYNRRELVSDDFMKYATAELKSRYILSTGDIFSFVSYGDVADSILKLPFAMDLNDSVMAVSTPSFQNAVNIYHYYFLNKYDERESLRHFKPLFHSASINFTGYVRELLQGKILLHFAQENAPGFDSVYHSFVNNSRNVENKRRVENGLLQIRAEQNKTKGVDEAVSRDLSRLRDEVEVRDMQGGIRSIRAVFSDSKITVIDCWASWCSPCLTQIPFLDKIKEQFKDRVHFVNLSFDRDVEKWKNSVRKLNKNDDLTKDFLLLDEFVGTFADFFNLKAIPRYILVSEDGLKVLDADMPRPSKQVDFIEVLEKFLE